MKRASLLIGLTLAVGGPCGLVGTAQAEVMGKPSYLDSRMQRAMYSPDEVYRLNAFVGRTSMIELEAGETVNQDNGVIVTGDEKAWHIGATLDGTAISLKPGTMDKPNTNLLIRTNKRTYALDLVLVNSERNMTYVLRWDYPLPPSAKKSVPERDLNPNPCGGVMNRAYQRRGDKAVSPYEAWDNGTFTCFRFPTSMPRPIVTEVMPDGTEMLANVRTVQNILVVHGVGTLFRFRLNDQVLEVRTRQRLGGFYNYDQTTTGEIRVIKNGQQ